MPLTREQMDRKLDEHFGFEADDDVGACSPHSRPTPSTTSSVTPPARRAGARAARAFYVGMFADLAESRVTPLRRLYGDGFLVDESMWEGRAPGRPFGFDGRDLPLKFRLLHVLEFAGDGKIAREQVWVDLAAVARQLARE